MVYARTYSTQYAYLQNIKNIPFTMENKIRLLALLLFNITLEPSPKQWVITRRQNSFTNDTIIHLEKSRKSTKKNLLDIRAK